MASVKRSSNTATRVRCIVEWAVNSEGVLAVTDCNEQMLSPSNERGSIGEIHWERSAWWFLAWNYISSEREMYWVTDMEKE